MNRLFCSSLAAQEGEPLEGTAPAKKAVIFLPAKKSLWHHPDNKDYATRSKRLIRNLDFGIPENQLLTAYYSTKSNGDSNLIYSAKNDVVRAHNLEGEEVTPPKLVVAVCTDGRKDVCCAKFGLPVYQDFRRLAEIPPGTSIVECSHIGGCRFAATLLCLPSGNVYGRIRTQDLQNILSSEEQALIFADAYRGNIYASDAQCWAMKLSAYHFGVSPLLSEIAIKTTAEDRLVEVVIKQSKTHITFTMLRQTRMYRFFSGCGHLSENRSIERELYSLVI